MIGRVLRFEMVGLRRSPVLLLTVFFAMGGAVLGRAVTWLASLVADSEFQGLLYLDPLAGHDIALPLALLAYVIAAAYVFGRDFADGTADVVLTAPVKRDAIVLAKLLLLLVWTLVLATLSVAADALTRWTFALSSVDPGAAPLLLWSLVAALAAFAGLPLVAWVALRFRGVVSAVGAGIALWAVSVALRGFEIGAVLPWNASYELVAGSAGVGAIIGPMVLFGAGAFACLWEIRRLDLV